MTATQSIKKCLCPILTEGVFVLVTASLQY